MMPVAFISALIITVAFMAVLHQALAQPAQVPSTQKSYGIKPQKKDPLVASYGRLEEQLYTEIKKTKVDIDINRTEKDQLQRHLADLEQKFDSIKAKLATLGIPTIDEFRKDPAYWISKSSSLDIARQGVKTCSCNTMAQFELGYQYPCYMILTCSAYDGYWSQLQIGQSDTQILGTGNDYEWITPFWLVMVNGDNMVHYSYSYYAYDNASNELDSDTNSSVADVTWISPATKIQPTLYNIPANSSLDAFWYVNSIP